jgi:hypothetical protein
MADKIKLNLIECIEKTKKDNSGKYYINKDEIGVEYLSQTLMKEGEGEYYITVTTKEFNGKPSTVRWISTEEYKPKGKDGKPFYPKQPDQVAMFKEAMVLVAEHINLGIIVKPKTVEELRKLILSEFEWIKGNVK